MASTPAKLGYAEYVRIPIDGQRHEIIGGEHVVNPAPNTYHQAISIRLGHQLFEQVEKPGIGRVFCAPTDLVLSDNDIVQPDLMVILDHSAARIDHANVTGPPDLVIEILSPTTEAVDRRDKKRLYAAAGVREYCIVDTAACVVEQMRLDAAAYRIADRREDRIVLLDGAAVIDLAAVW